MSLFSHYLEQYPDIPGTDSDGYWSPRTSSCNWCEIDYDVTYHVAEFWNAISNLLFCICAVHLAYQLKSMQRKTNQNTSMYYMMLFYFTSLGLLGVGSGAYHGSLRWYPQKMDQMMELWTVGSLLAYVCLIRNACITNVLFVAAYICVAVLITFHHRSLFSSYIGISMVFVYVRAQYIAYRYTEYQWAMRYIYIVIVLFVIAGSFWTVDRYYCDTIQTEYIDFKGHAFWHIFVALAFHQCGMLLILMYTQNESQLASHVDVHVSTSCKLICWLAWKEQRLVY
eukprot:356596_1